MNETGRTWLRRPSAVTLIAGAMVAAGFMLTAVDWGWLTLAAVGTFSPGLLRELGWIRDKDELQMQAMRRAGYHAYLAGGLAAFLLVALVRSREEPLKDSGELATVILVILWFTWLLSSLHGYWGSRRTASRILIIFGSVWLAFNVVGNIEAGVVAVVMQSLLAVPFFLLSWAAGRWPRPAGIVLLGFSIFFFVFFRLYKVFGPEPLEMGRIIVIVLFVGPLLAGGFMLLGRGRSSEAGD